MKLSHREFLRLGLAGGRGLSLPTGVAGCGGISIISRGGANDSAQGSAGQVLKSAARLPEPFTVPLLIPPVLEPTRRAASADYYEITQRVGQAAILPGLTTEGWGYNGIFPGPTIISRRGRRAVVRHRNELAVPTVVHLHGGKTPPEHDGYPTDLLLPVGGGSGDHAGHGGNLSEGTKEYSYPLDQPVATLWYHDRHMDFTGPQVYKGLAGFHLVHDDEEEALGLPAGERDIPLMIADRAFAADGSFDYPSLDPSLRGNPGVKPDAVSGVLGDCILVNGAPWPVLEVTNTRYRFRLLSASNARAGTGSRFIRPPRTGASFVQVGSDQGLLARPMPHSQVDIAQAERFDVVIDFSGYAVGDAVALVNRYGSGGAARVMRCVVARTGKDDGQIPSRLADVRPLSKAEATAERSLVFARGWAGLNGVTLWTINGKSFDPNRIDATPRPGAVELWKIRTLNVEQPIHIHLAPFQIVGKGDEGPTAYDQGWKDTVNMDNGGNAELLLKFDCFKGKYIFHCHNLEHEGMMMMTNFEVD